MSEPMYDDLDDLYVDEEEDRDCEACGGTLDINEGPICGDCTGIARCADDMCHGLGYCMHDPKAIQPW